MDFRNNLLFKRSEALNGPSSGGNDSREPVPAVGGKVVVVEADPSDQAHLAAVLSSMGFEVLTAARGEEALRLVEAHHPLLIISAMNLPDGDGYMLSQRVRETPEIEDIPFMFVVRKGEIPDQLIGHQSNAADYIQKPIPVTEFQTRVLSVLRFRGRDLSSDIPGKFRQRVEVEASEDESKQLASPSIDSDSQTAEMSSLTDLRRELRSFERRYLVEVSGRRDPEPFQERVRPSVRAAASAKVNPTAADTLKTRDACTREIAPVDSPQPDEALEEYDRPGESLAAMVTRRELETFPGDWLNQLQTDHAENPLYAECMAFVLHSLHSVQNGQNPQIESGRELAERLVEDLQTDSALLLEATNREQPYSVSAHSVNVAILSIPLCAAVEFEWERTVRIVLAGLLHEVGVAFLPDQLMHLQAKVSETELRLLRFRAKMSARVLERLGPQHEELAVIVGQVFEREDGSGFPSGLQGEEIREEAKALGLIDVFEACIHPRNHRAALSGYDTLFALTTDPVPAFPERLLRGLVRAFSLYPYNEIVVLNSGERGRVVKINPESLSRPVVQVLSDAFGRTLNEPAILDLAAHPSRYVAQTLGARLTD